MELQQDGDLMYLITNHNSHLIDGQREVRDTAIPYIFKILVYLLQR